MIFICKTIDLKFKPQMLLGLNVHTLPMKGFSSPSYQSSHLEASLDNVRPIQTLGVKFKRRIGVLEILEVRGGKSLVPSPKPLICVVPAVTGIVSIWYTLTTITRYSHHFGRPTDSTPLAESERRISKCDGRW